MIFELIALCHLWLLLLASEEGRLGGEVDGAVGRIQLRSVGLLLLLLLSELQLIAWCTLAALFLSDISALSVVVGLSQEKHVLLVAKCTAGCWGAHIRHISVSSCA